MNILYIHTHDAGRYFDCYGYGIGTPNITALAKRGTMFRQAFCSSPTCSPSRASQFTGMAAHSAGMLGLAHHGWNGGFNMPEYSLHLSQFLKTQGYETVLCGIQHEACEDSLLGYSRKLNTIDHIQLFDQGDFTKRIVKWDTANAKLTADYLLKRESNQPFFISYGMYSTHRPYPEDASVDERYLQPPVWQYDCADTRRDMAGYISGARVVDRCVAMVLDALQSSCYANNTMVIFTTDHGLPLPHMKCCLTDKGTETALIIDFPDNPARGEVIDALVCQTDIFPTICDYSHLAIPHWVQGKSLRPLFEGEKQLHTAIYSEVNYHIALQPMRSIRTNRYRYVKHFYSDASVGLTNIDNSSSKQFAQQSGYLVQHVIEELYDLYLDPHEATNIATQSPQLCSDLRIQMEQWMVQTNDPLLHKLPERPVTAEPSIVKYTGDFTEYGV